MAYTRPHGTVVIERLLYWYLFRRKGEISLALLAELYSELQKPARGVRWGQTKERDQMNALRKTLEGIINGNKGNNVVAPLQVVPDGASVSDDSGTTGSNL